MIYGTRSNGNHHGLVLTKPLVVDIMLDRVGYIANLDLQAIKVIEPAAGDGAFAVSIIKRLHASSLKFGFSFQEALSNLVFFEIDEKMASILAQRIECQLKKYAAILPKDLIRIEDFLLSNTEKCNIIIGNPPYVRHENIPEDQKKKYRRYFSTFKYRSDIYIAFYEKGLKSLKDNGILSFICSNRWLKNQYGKNLRNLIRLSYSFNEIINLEETCPFEEDVIAYPAITTISNSQRQLPTNYYQIHDLKELKEIDINVKPTKTLDTINSLNWFSYEINDSPFNKYLDFIEEQGFKVGIGVATGSDAVFIGKDFGAIVEKELLIPILMSKDLKNNELKWSENYLINPFDSRGDLIDLNQYPKAKKYFESNKDLLTKRHIAIKKPNLWYKTIDRINPKLMEKDKILLPDISKNSYLIIDRGNYYPHHNLYYITGQNYNKLVLLAAILMSDFVRNQLLELGNKMNGGYPRWQSQYLKKLKIPIIDIIPQEMAEMLEEAYHNQDYQAINSILTENAISRYSFSVGQATLFEPENNRYSSDV